MLIIVRGMFLDYWEVLRRGQRNMHLQAVTHLGKSTPFIISVLCAMGWPADVRNSHYYTEHQCHVSHLNL